MLKLQYFGHPMQRADSLEKIGKDCKQEEKWTREDVMFGGHHRLNGLEFEQAPGIVMDREVWCARSEEHTSELQSLG